MMQSPEFQEFLRMLQSPGPVNMEIARKTAHEKAAHDDETDAPKPDPPVAPNAAAAFDDVVRAVQLLVAEATSMSGALTVPARTVDRKTWADATLTGLEPVLAALATALEQEDVTPASDDPAAASLDAIFTGMMPKLVPFILGFASGGMIGALSHHALGQYDLPLPLTGEPAMSFVVSNVDAFAQEWALPNDELRYALALREVVHGAQRSVPWVREHLVRLASSYVGAYEPRGEALEDLFSGLDLSDPASIAGIEQVLDPTALLDAMRSERQEPLLEQLQRFVSVLEGYTDVVVATLGERMVASHVRIDEALRRHRLERGSAATFVDRLLGLQLDRDHYEAGLTFCRGVVERSGGTLEQLNRLWIREELVPTQSELAAPGLWLARIDLPES